MARASTLLPDAFKGRMRELLDTEFDQFLASFDQPRVRALRLNPAKVTAGELRELIDVELVPIPWCDTGFVFPSDVSLGGHPAHLAGLFYLQEPSAMIAAEVVAPEKGWLVADLAASPGGKTTHLAALVGDSGLVVANEVVKDRLRPLHASLDLWGAPQVVTANRRVGELAGTRFDAVLLDAPCTGEALFRRDPSTIRQWRPEIVQGSARRQAQLLARAAELVRPGGVLVYSTCSFEIEENEQQVADFLDVTPNWTLEDCCEWPGLQPGHPVGKAPTERTARLWPHHIDGEGQFVARLRRTDDEPASTDRHDSIGRRTKKQRRTTDADAIRRSWREFQQRFLPTLDVPDELLHIRGDRLYRLPAAGATAGLPVEERARPGLPLGRARPGRFEPHPALATTTNPELVRQRVSWPVDAPQLAAYLRGETVADAGEDGWVLVCYERWPIGWAKRSKGVLKNRFPAHSRLQAARWRSSRE